MDIDYEIHFSRRRSIAIEITNSGVLMVRAPYGMPKSKILDFLNSKGPWITKKVEKLRNQHAAVEKLGLFSQLELNVIRKKAREVIPERVALYAHRFGFEYGRISIRLQKTRWGSCSASGNLNFNCLLVLMPVPILDSVVVHELCHLHHMNHSKAFYDEVVKMFPDYRACDKWLKENGGIFMARVPDC